MSSRTHAHPGVEELPGRRSPATLTVRPKGQPWIDPEPQPVTRAVTAAAKPGLETAQAHSGGVVHWSPG
jgi:hypothetical protein